MGLHSERMYILYNSNAFNCYIKFEWESWHVYTGENGETLLVGSFVFCKICRRDILKDVRTSWVTNFTNRTSKYLIFTNSRSLRFTSLDLDYTFFIIMFFKVIFGYHHQYCHYRAPTTSSPIIHHHSPLYSLSSLFSH